MTQAELQMLCLKKQSAETLIDILDAYAVLYSKYPKNPLGIDITSSTDIALVHEKMQLWKAVKKIIERQNVGAIEAAFSFAYLYVHAPELPTESAKLDVVKNPQNYLSDDYQNYVDYLENDESSFRIKEGMSLLS